MKILGIDPGIGICGFGLIETSARASARALDYGAGYCLTGMMVRRSQGMEEQSSEPLEIVNFIAESLEKEYPDVVFQTFAYRSTRKPPTNITLRKNVSIFYCTLDHDLTRPLTSSDRASNISIVKDLEGWAKISSMIDIWDYATTFPSPYTPMTNLRVVAEDIKFFHKNTS